MTDEHVHPSAVRDATHEQHVRDGREQVHGNHGARGGRDAQSAPSAPGQCVQRHLSSGQEVHVPVEARIVGTVGAEQGRLGGRADHRRDHVAAPHRTTARTIVRSSDQRTVMPGSRVR